MGRKPKVIFFTHYNTMNGANQSLLTLIAYLENEIEVKMVVVYGKSDEGGGLVKELEARNIAYRIMELQSFLYFSGFKSFLSIPLKIIRSLPLWKLLYKELKNEDIDWVYSNSSVENTGMVMAKLLKVKHLWHIREFGYRDYKYHHIGGHFSKRRLFSLSTMLIANSKSISRYIGLPVMTKIVYNGIFSLTKLSSIKGKKSGSSVKKLGMVGIISGTKNQARALQLVNYLVNTVDKRVPLNIYGNIGDTDYFQKLKSTVEDYGIKDFVSFEGFVDDQTEIYSNIDILLMCSMNEAFGRVTVEAMAYGIPVVGFDNAGTRELIQHGVNGFLYDNENQDMEEVVKRLLEDEALYQEISENAQRSAADYSVEKYGDSILDVLKGSSN